MCRATTGESNHGERKQHGEVSPAFRPQRHHRAKGELAEMLQSAVAFMQPMTARDVGP